MDQKFEEYKSYFLEQIRINAQAESVLPDEYFLNDMLDKLVNMGEIVDPIVKSIRKKCRNQKIMSFDAYAFDESDKSLVLISKDYMDNEDSVLTKSEIDVISQRMLNFLQEAFDGKLDKYFDSTDEMLQIGHDMEIRLKKEYVDFRSEVDISIDKIKLFILTNKTLSRGVTSLSMPQFLGKKVELNIWGIQRLFDLYQSGREREPIYIDTAKYGVKGIPCIKAEMTDNLDYDAYLAIVPGKFLNDIYYEHGSRLLEGNVRVFLSTRGKINKGIRNTIHKEPTKFFAYNNGIACTASRIELSNDGRSIVGMEDLQIINGGQTTASLASAVLKDKMSLDNIFVPMKLTVVKNDEYDEMIQNISKYANSQNKVKDSDLFSNHPFHRRFEELSKKIVAPIVNGGVSNTYWYYERSRGKFENEQFKLIRKSEKDAFLRIHPKNQVIKKEELAKYYIAAELMRPDIVSKGAEKSMAFFAEKIDSIISKDDEFVKYNVNEEFFKKCIAYTILFRKTDYIVNHAPWYETGGNKYNIVPYTISKLIASIPDKYVLDYRKIWKNQDLSYELKAEIERIALLASNFINDSGGTIIGEYCKKEETWKKFKAKPLALSSSILDDLISREYIEGTTPKPSKGGDDGVDIDVDITKKIYEYPSIYWFNLLDAGERRGLLTDKDKDFLKLAYTLRGPRPKSCSPAQYKAIWKVRAKLEKYGVLVD